MKCLNCSKILTKRQTKYCCNQCQKDFEYKNYIQIWKENKVDGLRGKYQLSNHIIRYIKEKYDNKCARCGWNEVNPFTKTAPLEIEHIDGNYTNNIEENLILLCPNCHSLTSTYKGANKGNGRKERKKYFI